MIAKRTGTQEVQCLINWVGRVEGEESRLSSTKKWKEKQQFWEGKKTSRFIVNLCCYIYFFYFQRHDKASLRSLSQTEDPCWQNFRLLSEFYWQTFCLYFTAVNKFCHCLEPSSFQCWDKFSSIFLILAIEMGTKLLQVYPILSIDSPGNSSERKVLLLLNFGKLGNEQTLKLGRIQSNTSLVCGSDSPYYPE